jgi:uncharacterized membrane protein
MAFPFLLLFVAEGLGLAALAVPLIRRRVPRNGWYGFRVPKTLASDDVWYPANAYCGRLLYKTGLAFALSAVLLSLVPGMNGDRYASACTTVMLIGLAITVVKSFAYLRRL